MTVLPPTVLVVVFIFEQSIANPINSETDLRSTPEPTLQNYRLNKNYEPTEYKIKITVPDDFHKIGERQFNGNVTISVKKRANASSDVLQLHVDKYISNYNSLSIQIGSEDVPTEKYSYNSTTEILEITDLTDQDQFDLTFSYIGQIYDDMYGFYLSEYTDDQNNAKYIATTQFQPTYARRAFPCWDEPEYKAKFTISLDIPTGYNAISNQPTNLPANDDNENRRMLTFQTTPKMSTYLVAFVVSDFKSKNVIGSKKMKVWAPKKLIANAAYAAKISWKILEAQGKLLDKDNTIPFFPKMGVNHLDTVAIPDFAAGAMENWGLMTFRETALLVDSKSPKMKEEQSVAKVIAHEFAHSWFGNWVTTHWWSDTWLNEGFATYFESHCIVEIPGMEHFETDKQFVLNEVHAVMETDGNAGALPVSSKDDEVNTVPEIMAKFGTITYSKGGSIVRMMEKLVGKDTFMKKLTAYLKKASMKDISIVTPNALFENFDKINETDFKDIMDGWITQSGYPVVNARLDGNKVVINQTQFLYKESKKSTLQWHVPITYEIFDISTSTAPIHSLLTVLKPNEDVKEIASLSEEQAIIINPESRGFYRVKYDTKLWARIVKKLSNDHEQVDDLTRAQLINDAMNLARADQLAYKDAFELLDYMKKETNYYPWHAAFTAFSYLRKRLIGDLLHNDITEKMVDLAKTFFKENEDFTIPKEEKESAIKIYARVLALEWACELKEKDCVDKALDLFKTQKVDPNFNSIVYCAGLRHSQNATTDWNMMFGKFNDATNAAEKVNILTALGCTTDKALLKTYLEMSLDNTLIRSQDASTVFKAVLAGNPEGIEVAQSFLQDGDNFNKIRESYGSMGALSNVFLQLADRLTNPIQVKSFTEFVERNKADLGDAVGVAQNAIAAAEANIEWASTAKQQLKDYLHDNDQPDTSYTLDTNFTPDDYQVNLEFNNFTMNKTFTGKVVITGIVQIDKLKYIRLHAANEIHLTQVLVGSYTITDEEISYNKTTEILRISTKSIPLTKGESIKVSIQYEGILSGDMNGVYLSLVDKLETIATTQFHPTYARRAFPCFDEPSFKAYFTLSVTAPKAYTVLSNQPETTTSMLENMKVSTFSKTPKMSPYLVAFMVCQFDSEIVQSSPSIGMNIWAPRNKTNSTKFAAEVSYKILETMSHQLNNDSEIDITVNEMGLLQMDQVAIPDFGGGAMENWGLVMYKESKLLWDSSESTLKAKESVGRVIAHEVAHNWFGNWVTTRWWNTAWLHEAFANYFEYHGIRGVAAMDDYQLEKQYLVQEVLPIMETDAGDSQLPLTSEVNSLSEIRAKFGEIIYSKGGSIIRMLRKIVGDEFMMYLNYYIDTHKGETVVPNDLLSIFPNVHNLTISEIMNNWLTKPGYPVVDVSLANMEANATVVTLSQRQFSYQKLNTTTGTEWYVPIWYSTYNRLSGNVVHSKMHILKPGANQTLPVPNNKDIVTLINPQRMGYYRVNYDKGMWENIVTLLSTKHTLLEPEVRAHLIDDAMNLARAGQLSYETAFKVLEYLKLENDYIPWKAATNAFAYLQRLQSGNSILWKRMSTMIDGLMVKLLEDYRGMSVDPELKPMELYAKVLLLQWRCLLANGDCIKEANEVWNDNKQSAITRVKRIDPNVRGIVYCSALQYSGNATEEISNWEILWEKYLQTPVANVKEELLTALGCTQNKDLIEKYLSYSLNRTVVRAHDESNVFKAVLEGSSSNAKTSIQFLDSQFENISKNYLSKALSLLGEKMSSDDDLKQFTEFVTKHRTDLQEVVGVADAAIITANNNIDWVQKNEATLNNFFKDSSAGYRSQMSFGLLLATLVIIFGTYY